MPPLGGAKSIKNIALVAHIDAGKTTLSESILFLSGAISEVGTVEEGLTTLDYLEEEQTRGITIEAGLASFLWKSCEYTLLDTPGHLDFENETNVSLQGVEGAILLISATSGVEVQTIEGWKKLQSQSISPLIFLNKLDLECRPIDSLLEQIEEVLEVKPFLMSLPVYREGELKGVVDVLNEVAIYPVLDSPRAFRQAPVPEKMKEALEKCREELYSVATSVDDSLTEAILQGKKIDKAKLVHGLVQAVKWRRGVPVYVGTALQNIGVRQLLNGCHFFVPPPQVNENHEVWAKVLRIKTWRSNYLALLKIQKNLTDSTTYPALHKVHGNHMNKVESVQAGEIVAAYLKDLPECRLGDELGVDGKIKSSAQLFTYVPLLKTRMEPVDKAEFTQINKTLKEWVALDASLALEYEKETGNWLLSTLGEVQLAVIKERLEKETGCRVNLGTPSIKYLERINKKKLKFKNKGALAGYELSLTLEVVGDLESIENKLVNQSGNTSKQVTDCLESFFSQFIEKGLKGFGSFIGVQVTLTELSCNQSSFPMGLLYKVLQDCLALNLKREDVDVFEPVVRLTVSVPNSCCGAVLDDLQEKRAEILSLETEEKKKIILSQVPLQRTFGYTTLLRSMSKGQGTFRIAYEKHDKVK